MELLLTELGKPCRNRLRDVDIEFTFHDVKFENSLTFNLNKISLFHLST